jgi:hypothetical protein
MAMGTFSECPSLFFFCTDEMKPRNRYEVAGRPALLDDRAAVIVQARQAT